MVKKLGKRRRKELAKAKRAKRMKDKMVDDNITKFLYVGQCFRELAEEMNVDYISVADEDEISGPVWEPDKEEDKRGNHPSGAD